MLNLKWLLKKASTGARVIPSGVEGSQKWLDFPIPRFFPPQADPPVVGALLRMTRKIVFQQPLKGLLPKWFCEENCRFFFALAVHREWFTMNGATLLQKRTFDVLL